MFLVYIVIRSYRDKVSQFLSSKCKGAYGVSGKEVGDGGESIYFQHRKPNRKAAYLFLISHTKMF